MCAKLHVHVQPVDSAGSTALREFDSTTEAKASTSSEIKWPIEPRLRVMPSYTALSSLNDLIVRPISVSPFSSYITI